MKISNSEITPYKDYINRRKFIKNCGITALLSSLSPNSFAQHELGENSYNHLLSNADSLNTFEEITTYNNFYEFGVAKSDPSQNSDKFNPKPWSINDKYTFLFFASVLHFIFIPITIFGSFNLFREKINFRILLIFFILMGLCYSYVFFENRHRIQFSFIYIWAQYNFLYKIFTTNFFYQKRKIVN